MSDDFAARVGMLRESWVERRDLHQITKGDDLESQFQMLLRLYRWASKAVTEIQTIYGEQAPAMISDPPDCRAGQLAFQVQIGKDHVLTILLAETSIAGRPTWKVHGTVRLFDGPSLPVSPARRSWTRRSLEDSLLGLLTDYERRYEEDE